MPFLTSIVNRRSRIVKFLLHTTYYILLTAVLSGCSAIGTSKPAALQVTSIPEAAVFLDGKHLGKTPFYSDQLKSGTHTLKITATEASFATQVDLQESTLTVVNRQLADNFLAQSGEILSLVSGKTSLMVISQPKNATLTVDGKLIGNTPLAVNDITVGEHKLQLSHDNFASREFMVKVVNNYQLQVNITLASILAKDLASPTPVPTTQKVKITQTPQGFLRVRQDASINTPEIGRVNTGDQFEIIQESPGWVKISFNGKQGWVSADYTKKL
jgi:uncharacterized protein YgiM (DUF1202 family)